MASRQAGGRRGAARWTVFLGAAIVATLLLLSALYPAPLELAELKAFDLRMYAGGTPKTTGLVAIAAVDDKSLAELGRWPWPRSTLGKLVSALQYYKAATVGFDYFASEKDPNDVQREAIATRLRQEGETEQRIAALMGPSSDEAFAQALKEQGSTIMGYPFESHGLPEARPRPAVSGFIHQIVPPEPITYGLVRTPSGPLPPIPTAPGYQTNEPTIAQTAAGQAYIDVDIDGDAITRSEMTVIQFNNHYYVPLYLALVKSYLKDAMLQLSIGENGVSYVQVGDIDIPVDELGRMLVKFRGPEKTFPHYSIADIINHRVEGSKLAGKIVIVGVTGKGLGDRVATPMGDFYPGVELHANAIDNVLRGDFVHRSEIDAFLSRLAAVLLGLAVSFAVAHLSAKWAAAATVAMAVSYFAFAQFALMANGVLLGVLLPIGTLGLTSASLMAYRYATEGREKRFLRRAFEYYLDPRVIESVVNQPETLALSGERRHLSILFSDIVGFTSRAERSNPEELVGLLNIYMTVMTDLIMQSGGVVDKLMGDGIMAFWGAPVEVANPARAAVDCALKMIEELEKLRHRDKRFADFDIGIGIATGEAIVGNIGGERRFHYTLIGDNANLASRTEGLTRQFKVRILITRETLNEANGAYVAREIGIVKVKGKKQAVPIVEVAGMSVDGAKDDYYARFSAVVESLHNGVSITQARDEFTALSKERPDDHVAQMYLELLHKHKGTATELVFEFETK